MANDKAGKSPRLSAKRKVKWTKDDSELTVLAIPTTVWFIAFCYLPLFGIVPPVSLAIITKERVELLGVLSGDYPREADTLSSCSTSSTTFSPAAPLPPSMRTKTAASRPSSTRPRSGSCAKRGGSSTLCHQSPGGSGNSAACHGSCRDPGGEALTDRDPDDKINHSFERITRICYTDSRSR